MRKREFVECPKIMRSNSLILARYNQTEFRILLIAKAEGKRGNCISRVHFFRFPNTALVQKYSHRLVAKKQMHHQPFRMR